MMCFYIEVLERLQVFPQGLSLQPPAVKEFPAQPRAMDAVPCRQALAMVVLLGAPSS